MTAPYPLVELEERLNLGVKGYLKVQGYLGPSSLPERHQVNLLTYRISILDLANRHHVDFVRSGTYQNSSVASILSSTLRLSLRL